MKGGKIAGIILLIVGVIGLVISVIADFIGVGFIGASPGFGTIQIIGIAVGAILIGIGTFLLAKK
ncbi:MAG: hypothetical protein JSV25_02090 [Spirochaetota bacterium]|nr:MAG: hypothetical protein JSV25_02090 [Spirochaetota bacterium]